MAGYGEGRGVVRVRGLRHREDILNVLDLFCGAAGGWSFGLHRAGMRTVAACEVDPVRRVLFQGNYPDALIYDDVRTLTAQRLAADGIGAIDVVAGSPPCQDASTANTSGKGAGGARTGLVADFVRLVREIQPRWVLFENVPGLRTRGVDWVLSSLAAAGYPSWPLVVGAWHAGAPHKRNRVWVVAPHVSRIGRGSWGPRGPVASDEGREAARQHADTQAMQRPALTRNQSDGDYPLFAADPENGHGRALATTAGDGDESAGCAPADADERAIRKPVLPGEPEPEAAEPEELADAHAARSGCEGVGGQGEEGTAERREAAWERAVRGRVGSIADIWNGGIAGRFGMDDGIPKGMAATLLSAYGDAVVPIIPELIGRIVMRAERELTP